MYGATLEQARPWIDAFAKRLETMLDIIVQRFPGGCHVFLADIYDPTDGFGDAPSVYLPDWPDALAIDSQYNAILHSAAQRRANVHLVPMHETFLGHGIHCRQFWRRTYCPRIRPIGTGAISRIRTTAGTTRFAVRSWLKSRGWPTSFKVSAQARYDWPSSPVGAGAGGSLASVIVAVATQVVVAPDPRSVLISIFCEIFPGVPPAVKVTGTRCAAVDLSVVWNLKQSPSHSILRILNGFEPFTNSFFSTVSPGLSTPRNSDAGLTVSGETTRPSTGSSKEPLYESLVTIVSWSCRYPAGLRP